MRGAREGKKQRLVRVSQRFLSETVVVLVELEKMAVDFTRFFEEEIVGLFAYKTTNNKVSRRREQQKIDADPRGGLYTFYPC